MIASVEFSDGTRRSIEAGDPVCGQDFCEECGDCLHCYQDATDHVCWWFMPKEDERVADLERRVKELEEKKP